MWIVTGSDQPALAQARSAALARSFPGPFLPKPILALWTTHFVCFLLPSFLFYRLCTNVCKCPCFFVPHVYPKERERVNKNSVCLDKNGPAKEHSFLHLHLSLNRGGRWGTTDDLTTSFLHFSLFSAALWVWRTAGLSIPWYCLPTFFSVYLVYFFLSLCPARWFCQTWRTGDMSIPLQFASRCDVQEVFVCSDCLLDLGTEVFVGNVVFVWDA